MPEAFSLSKTENSVIALGVLLQQYLIVENDCFFMIHFNCYFTGAYRKKDFFYRFFYTLFGT